METKSDFLNLRLLRHLTRVKKRKGLKKCTQGMATEIAKDMTQIAFSVTTVTKVTKLIIIDIDIVKMLT